ncbi:SDR family oxidoreductase [Aquabacterium sp. A3]|uniref:SDR family oxidoreductase n=1 Tax=Aquabacterium sp. A3 TaxID=3132829 RepID=UPI00311A3948
MATRPPLVIITGCGSGIGQALARAFHARGLPVCATARRLDTLAPLAAEGLMTRPLDVTDEASVQALLTGLAQEGHQIGTLVNNAGYGAMGPMLDVPTAEWQRQFDVNLFAPMALTRAVLPGMIARRRGLVVNISSVSGVLTTPFAGPYCASKAAFNAASDALRMELAPLGVKVVTVQPGGIQSAFGSNAGNAVSLGADSPYQAIKASVLARANESQSNAMPADTFARLLVDQLLKADGPPVVRLGEKSTLLPALKQWLPTRLLDRVLSKKFGLDGLK